MVTAKKLSERQKNILKYIEAYVDERGYPPSIREIGDQVGISSTSVVDYNLKVLEREGRIRRDREVSRGLELVGGQRGRARARGRGLALRGGRLPGSAETGRRRAGPVRRGARLGPDRQRHSLHEGRAPADPLAVAPGRVNRPAAASRGGPGRCG